MLTRPLVVVTCAVATIVVVAGVGLWFAIIGGTAAVGRPTASVPPAPTVVSAEQPELLPEPRPLDEPRRLPVVGRPGYFVRLAPDGSATLEAPDGTRSPLLDAQPTSTLIDAAIAAAEQAASPPRPGQLVVCDAGVVDVPKEAIITYVGRDHVVVLRLDGTSMAVYVDGRSEARGRRPAESGGHR